MAGACTLQVNPHSPPPVSTLQHHGLLLPEKRQFLLKLLHRLPWPEARELVVRVKSLPRICECAGGNWTAHSGMLSLFCCLQGFAIQFPGLGKR